MPIYVLQEVSCEWLANLVNKADLLIDGGWEDAYFKYVVGSWRASPNDRLMEEGQGAQGD